MALRLVGVPSSHGRSLAETVNSYRSYRSDLCIWGAEVPDRNGLSNFMADAERPKAQSVLRVSTNGMPSDYSRSLVEFGRRPGGS